MLKKDKQLLIQYFKTKHEGIYQNVIQKYKSERILEKLSETLLFFNMILGERRAKNKLRRIVKNLTNQNNLKADIIISEIEKKKDNIAKSERERRYKKYIEGIYSDRYFLERMPQIKKQYLPKIKKIKEELNRAFDSVGKDIENKHKIEKGLSDLAAIARNVREEICYKFFGYYEGAHKFDFKYWKNKGYKIGYVYILSNPYFPGLVKIGKAENSAIDRARSLSRGTGDTKKILEYLEQKHEFIYRPDIIADTLSKITGVPGDFNVEYHRLTILDFPLQLEDGKTNYIETVLHKVMSSMSYKEYKWGEENLSPDITKKEFFVVPSVRFAVLIVEEMLDRSDFLLNKEQLINNS